MPVKRAVMIRIKKDILTYALRADVPAGFEKPNPGYRSSYNDPEDPDLGAIRGGAVVEVFRTLNVKPGPSETKSQLVARVQGEIEAGWDRFQKYVNFRPHTKDVVGRFWDGSAWQIWTPPPPDLPIPL